ncbi:YeeE/YedE family protein [Roseicella aquatilis]|uniref:YeeE/YedE family protein n=1 Tax=Roseicella aquatilis TaxID=2527868 RepID=A0A4R4DJY1_9PROT|nr:YeeE/YedE family protein [Roseicella aquatilis]TCZ61025.1 YeeE/YedE family protein [Roseicella aquatilis]
MTSFTPLASAAGGVLIGASAAVLWLTLGRIAGISGILGGLTGAPGGDRAWRLAFLTGLVGAPLAWAAALGPPEVRIAAGPLTLVLAGLLVGFGTRLGSGCTSGHGVCGLARLSPRSVAATVVFMATAAATVFVARHVIGG